MTWTPNLPLLTFSSTINILTSYNMRSFIFALFMAILMAYVDMVAASPTPPDLTARTLRIDGDRQRESYNRTNTPAFQNGPNAFSPSSSNSNGANYNSTGNGTNIVNSGPGAASGQNGGTTSSGSVTGSNGGTTSSGSMTGSNGGRTGRGGRA